MTPAQVEALTDDEYSAFVRFMARDARDTERAIADAKRRR